MLKCGQMAVKIQRDKVKKGQMICPKGGRTLKEANKKVISRLKEVRVQKGMTYQDIVDACELQNEAVSFSTVKRMFSKAGEEGPDYRTSTINAVFHAVIGTEEMELSESEEAALTDPGKEAIIENAALKAVVELKDATIEELQRQIDTLKEEKAALEGENHALQIRLDTTVNMFRMAMESLNKQVINS